jgi:hypothetical protein
MDSDSDSSNEDSDTHIDSGNIDNIDNKDDDNDNDIIDDKSAEQPLPVERGTKQLLDTTSLAEDGMIPKIKKNLDGSRQRLKAGDFDVITKDILTTAFAVFRCLIVTQVPFPNTILIETKLVKEAWHEACNTMGASTKLTPSLVKVVSWPIFHILRLI